jgi:hypothetical protein
LKRVPGKKILILVPSKVIKMGDMASRVPVQGHFSKLLNFAGTKINFF